MVGVKGGVIPLGPPIVRTRSAKLEAIPKGDAIVITNQSKIKPTQQTINAPPVEVKMK